MRKYLFISVFFYCSLIFGDVYVKGYQKSNGTYVEPHYRSSPNNTTSDNWSTKGNINPYTGKEGTISTDTNDEESISSSDSDQSSVSSSEVSSTMPISYPPPSASSVGVIFTKVENTNYYVNNSLTSFPIYKWVGKNKLTYYCDHPPF
ncbi:hypothetical protein ACQUW5_04270 [Legionella sp. CNM-1927-20]|uniref:hypothetical protein n=1 Tax=Legionella sp. CNM-1927-20 TaxID=3422221 RepID=UPI00403AA1A0